MSTDEDVLILVIDPKMLAVRWFYVVRYFDTPDEAKVAYDAIDDYAAGLDGAAQYAGYRLFDGLPSEGGQPRIVAVLGEIESRVREAAQILGGAPYHLEHGMVRALALRRLRFLQAQEALDADGGHYSFDHGKGMALNREGQPVPLEEA
jgi:hypothetical protein